jgi:hypothetical protein
MISHNTKGHTLLRGPHALENLLEMTKVSLCASTSSIVDLFRLGDMAQQSLWNDMLRSEVDRSRATIASGSGESGQTLLSGGGNALTSSYGCLSSFADSLGVGSRVGNSTKKVRRNDVAAARHDFDAAMNCRRRKLVIRISEVGLMLEERSQEVTRRRWRSRDER